MLSWVKFVQGLVALAGWVTRQLTRQQDIQQGETIKDLADAQLELQLDRQITATDDAFDANADRMQRLYGDTKTRAPGEGGK